MPDKTPHGRVAVSGPPGAWFSERTVDSSVAMVPGFPIRASIPVYPGSIVPTEFGFQHSSVSGFPLPCLNGCISIPCCPHGGNLLGLPEFSDISLPTCHGLRTPADLRHPCHSGYLSCCLRCTLKPSASATNSSRSCTSTSGRASPLRPTGFSVYASPVLFTAFQRLRHGRKTRYGWVASPYPTGTFTPQETPSLSRRDNALISAAGVARSIGAFS
jgi:hypothetical protein